MLAAPRVRATSSRGRAPFPVSSSYPLQNHPELSDAYAYAQDGYVRVTGKLRSEILRCYRIEFFWVPACDESGHGEGRTFIGAISSQRTDDRGELTFAEHPTIRVSRVGGYVTATATDIQFGDTSDFSECVPIRGA